MSKSNFKDWPAMAASLNPAVGELRRSAPATMAAFSEMGKAALAPGALDTKTKELMALAVYMGAGPSAMYAAQGLEAFDQWSEKA